MIWVMLTYNIILFYSIQLYNNQVYHWNIRQKFNTFQYVVSVDNLSYWIFCIIFLRRCREIYIPLPTHPIKLQIFALNILIQYTSLLYSYISLATGQHCDTEQRHALCFRLIDTCLNYMTKILQILSLLTSRLYDFLRNLA